MHNFILVLTQLVVTGAQKARGSWESSEISSGTQHHMKLEYDPQPVRRVAAKIGYGLFLLASSIELAQDRDCELRKYILGDMDKEFEPVMEAPESLAFTTGGTPYHQVILGPPHDVEAAIVRLYGYGFRVDLGNAPRRLTRCTHRSLSFSGIFHDEDAYLLRSLSRMR